MAAKRAKKRAKSRKKPAKKQARKSVKKAIRKPRSRKPAAKPESRPQVEQPPAESQTGLSEELFAEEDYESEEESVELHGDADLDEDGGGGI